MTPVNVCKVGATLGEGPVWHAGALWFVDIKQRNIHCFTPGAGLQSWPAPAQPGWILPTDDGGWLTGLQTGIHRFDPATGSFDLHAVVEPDLPNNRLNDATVDPAGRLWLGSMDDRETGISGYIHCHDRGRTERTPIPPVAITNGPALSPDGRTLYHVDTRGKLITAYDVAPDATLSNLREFVRIEPGAGNPDGPTVDAEACVWIALYGGWSARRYSPAGELLATIRFPVANITKLAFGGDDLRTAYATTARHLLDDAALAAQPEAGDLFSFGVEVPGVRGQLIKMTDELIPNIKGP